MNAQGAFIVHYDPPFPGVVVHYEHPDRRLGWKVTFIVSGGGGLGGVQNYERPKSDVHSFWAFIVSGGGGFGRAKTMNDTRS